MQRVISDETLGIAARHSIKKYAVFGMRRRVALVTTDVSKECIASNIRVTLQKTVFFRITAVKTSDLT
jgi:hypothetical protein